MAAAINPTNTLICILHCLSVCPKYSKNNLSTFFSFISFSLSSHYYFPNGHHTLIIINDIIRVDFENISCYVDIMSGGSFTFHFQIFFRAHNVKEKKMSIILFHTSLLFIFWIYYLFGRRSFYYGCLIFVDHISSISNLYHTECNRIFKIKNFVKLLCSTWNMTLSIVYFVTCYSFFSCYHYIYLGNLLEKRKIL